MSQELFSSRLMRRPCRYEGMKCEFPGAALEVTDVRLHFTHFPKVVRDAGQPDVALRLLKSPAHFSPLIYSYMLGTSLQMMRRKQQ